MRPPASWDEIKGHYRVAERNFPMLADDMPTFMGVPHAASRADLEGADVAIIGAPYVAGAGGSYAGVDKSEWLVAPKRVRQQSIRYPSGYVQDFDLDIFEHLRVVDLGDADIPPEATREPTAENILAAQAAVEEKVGAALGGLLNATFGNAAELIIAIFALKAGLYELVKASITGSITTPSSEPRTCLTLAVARLCRSSVLAPGISPMRSVTVFTPAVNSKGKR